LSFRDIEDLLAERGLNILYETVRRWFRKFGPGSDDRHLDETVNVIRGKKYWPWRAVDNEGEAVRFDQDKNRAVEAKSIVT